MRDKVYSKICNYINEKPKKSKKTYMLDLRKLNLDIDGKEIENSLEFLIYEGVLMAYKRKYQNTPYTSLRVDNIAMKDFLIERRFI